MEFKIRPRCQGEGIRAPLVVGGETAHSMVAQNSMHPCRLVLPVLLFCAGCSASRLQVPVDSEVTFAAHEERHRLVIDRMQGGRPATLEPPGRIRWPGAPTFVLQADGKRVGSLQVTAPGSVEVRDGSVPGARVEPSWKDGAVRFALRTAGGPSLSTDVFSRVGAGLGPSVLSRRAQTILDVRGTYRADVRDATGHPVGWLRVRISPYQAAPRIYDGVLPGDVDLGLAAATGAALGSELDWIEAHVLDVYRGNAGGPLEQSIPMGDH